MTETHITSDLESKMLEAWYWRDRDSERAQGMVQKVLADYQEGLPWAQAKVVSAYLAFRMGFMVQALEESTDRKSTRLNSSHLRLSRMPSSA